MHISLDGFVAGPNGEMDWIKVDQEILISLKIVISRWRHRNVWSQNIWNDGSLLAHCADQPNASKHDRVHSKWYMNAHKLYFRKVWKAQQRKTQKIISENLVENIKGSNRNKDPRSCFSKVQPATHSLHQLNMIDGYWLKILSSLEPEFLCLKISRTKPH